MARRLQLAKEVNKMCQNGSQRVKEIGNYYRAARK